MCKLVLSLTFPCFVVDGSNQSYADHYEQHITFVYPFHTIDRADNSCEAEYLPI